MIQKSVTYWRTEFSQVQISQLPGPLNQSLPKFQVIPEQWIFQERCDDETDIRFQFGVLSENQKKMMDDPRDYLGIAVRTHYDRQAMKAKGFVYFSPASGPLKFNADTLHADPWQLGSGHLLSTAIVHELGHVFGISDDPTSFFEIMSERFFEFSFAKDAAENYELFVAENGPPKFGSFSESMHILETWCGLKLETVEFFALSSRSQCMNSKIVGGVLRLQVSDSFESEWHDLGSIKLIDQSQNAEYVPFLSVWFPKEQKVFEFESEGEETGSQLMVLGMKPRHSLFKGEFKSQDGSYKRPVSVHISPAGFIRINGFMNGEIYENVWN